MISLRIRIGNTGHWPTQPFLCIYSICNLYHTLYSLSRTSWIYKLTFVCPCHIFCSESFSSENVPIFLERYSSKFCHAICAVFAVSFLLSILCMYGITCVFFRWNCSIYFFLLSPRILLILIRNYFFGRWLKIL